MSAVLMVKRPGPLSTACTILATDIPKKAAARRLARSLASTYRENGIYLDSDVCWFRDGDGLAELWPVIR